MLEESLGATRRLACRIEYDGSGFSGWQSQIGVTTVQDCLEQALEKVAAHKIRVIVAGRTDTGVHATSQIVHFESAAERTERNWLRGVNTYLPPGISLHWVRPVAQDFHARFSAQRRRYRYIILRQKVQPGLLRNLVTWDHRDLDHSRMQLAARHLLGLHDFSSYRAVACQSKTPVKEIYRLDISASGPFVWLDIEANGFLHHMVRNIAGVLMAIGAGEKPVDWTREVLESRDRRAGGVTALPHGLYLTGVVYPDEFELPETTCVPRFW